MNKPHVLYRVYDAQGALLYIGITMNPGSRFAQHSEDKPWWTDVADIRVEHYGSREEVLAAERDAIKSEHPRFNVVHNIARKFDTAQAINARENQGRWCLFRDMSRRVRCEQLILSYELNGDPITDDYLPEEITADELLNRWLRNYAEDQHKPMRVWWFVYGPAIAEFAVPYEIYQPDMPHFLRYYSQPLDPQTHDPVQLHELPVMDKRWDHIRGDKGGFIQAATGWKPRALQEWVTPAEILNNYAFAGRSA
jgi:predicted GIY-YIG superfamily endonuclease